MLKTRTKTKLGAKAIRQVAKNPDLLRLAPPATKVTWKVAKPLAKRRARKRAKRIGQTAQVIATTVATYAPYVTRAAETLAPPKRKRAAPKIGAAALGTGAALGAAAALYFQGGRRHRNKLRG
ncbi:MAG: hypothetical protein M3071_07535 [Actinomycetota bacterium]|nr:hypothetical protein [Actinomycetota bacterium]